MGVRFPNKSFRNVRLHKVLTINYKLSIFVPSVAEWIKALESDASAGGESPVRAPVRAATLCPYA